MGQERVDLTVRGRVQGVFFRASTRSEAKRLGLTGWVKNRDDGHVEIRAEGDRPVLDELVKWAHRGPDAARVDGVEIRWSEASGDFAGFVILD